MEKNRSGKRVCKTEGDPVGWGQQVKIGWFWGRELLGKNGDRFPPRQSEEGRKGEGKINRGGSSSSLAYFETVWSFVLSPSFFLFLLATP